MTIRWADYKYCEEISFLEAAFLWLEIEPNHKPKREPPIHVKGLEDKIEKFVKQKRWEELLSKEDNQEKFIFDQVLENRKRKIFSYLDFNLFDDEKPEEDRDTRSKQERWKTAKKKPCSNAEREAVLDTMPCPYDRVTREELLCFADSLGEKPKFLFSENESSDGWNKGEISKSSYQELIKVLCIEHLEIDIKDKNAVGKIKLLAQKIGNRISDATIRDILDEVEPSRLNNSNRRPRKKK
jgi:hypothetical protein